VGFYSEMFERAQQELLAKKAHQRPEDPADVQAPLEPIQRPAQQPPPPPAYHLRLAYRRWFELTVAEVDGRRVDAAEAQVLHQRIVKLTDETGVLFSDAIYADELRRFRWETARCGACGGLGHEGPEPEGR
jgi:hypothetical protein